MTPEAQRIVIAEACGWKFSHNGNDQGMSYPLGDKDRRRTTLPDYLNDLNAMHEAERCLLQGDFNNALRDAYAANLRSMIGPYGTMRSFDYVHAAAAQRAEAFLRTIGKWKGTP